MKSIVTIIKLASLPGLMFLISCTSTKNLNYLQNLPEVKEAQYFPMDIPDYKVQYRDILYIDAKALTADGKLEDVLQSSTELSSMAYIQNETNQYLMGYNVDKEGNINLPIVGKISVSGKTLPEIRLLVQHEVDTVFKHTYVDCKLLSFKFTVLGEVKIPGTYVNYNNFLTVFEAIGRAGGVGDYGKRDRVLVIRPTENGSKIYRINLKDKSILTSEAYFLMPNDVVIIEPYKSKIFNMNLPTFSFILVSITSFISTTILLVNYLK